METRNKYTVWMTIVNTTTNKLVEITFHGFYDTIEEAYEKSREVAEDMNDTYAYSDDELISICILESYLGTYHYEDDDYDYIDYTFDKTRHAVRYIRRLTVYEDSEQHIKNNKLTLNIDTGHIYEKYA